MTRPDHRAEAASWVAVAQRRFGDHSSLESVIAAALIGIGHALLALGQQPGSRSFGESFDALMSNLPRGVHIQAEDD